MITEMMSITYINRFEFRYKYILHKILRYFITTFLTYHYLQNKNMCNH